MVIPPSVSPRASSGIGYESASSSRRMTGFQPTTLGPTTLLWSTLDLMRRRCRDEVRNNPYAASASDNFEAQCIGDGIFPHWNIDNPTLKKEIESKFFRWAREIDLYSKQSTACREIFEAGEVFSRFHIRPLSWGMSIPLDVELIEGEQCPIFLNSVQSGYDVPQGNSVRTGIEFDPSYRRVAYHMYRQHPGETALYPIDGLQYVRIPASEILHAFKPLRAGLLRGVPFLAPSLTLLHEISKYSDAAVVKKQIQTMFAGFVKKISPTQDILPPSTNDLGTTGVGNPVTSPDPGTRDLKIETGTMQELYEGEDITFPSLPQDNDIETFFSVFLHQFAASIGATYEQITGDLRGVNLSSIRYGVQVQQRKTTQFVRNVLIQKLLYPIAMRWLKEAVLAGELVLPYYARSPEKYEDITWRLPGWPYMDPAVDAQGATLRIRSGLSSRQAECAATGQDSTQIDEQQVADNKRSDQLGLIFDSDGRKVLPKGTKLTKDGEDDAGGVAGVKPKDSETPSETEKLSPPPPAPVRAPAPAPAKKAAERVNGHAKEM